MSLYPRVQKGGDYRERQGVTERIEPVDWTAVYWKKLN